MFKKWHQISSNRIVKSKLWILPHPEVQPMSIEKLTRQMWFHNGPLARYAKLRVMHAPGNDLFIAHMPFSHTDIFTVPTFLPCGHIVKLWCIKTNIPTNHSGLMYNYNYVYIVCYVCVARSQWKGIHNIIDLIHAVYLNWLLFYSIPQTRFITPYQRHDLLIMKHNNNMNISVLHV